MFNVMGDSLVHIGTSGWDYPHWKGTFYPADRPTHERLAYYTDHFQTVEVNRSFYQLPERSTWKTWRDSTPDDFVFAVKASRFITHMKKLKDPAEPVQRLLRCVEILGRKLGPILFQTPSRWKCNLERLTEFLGFLPSKHRYAFEFRDPSWFIPAVYQALEKRDVSFCIFEIGGLLSPRMVTSSLVYIRLHGPGKPYQGQYSADTLESWAKAIHGWRNEGRAVHCYFDNDQLGHAPQDALRLAEIVSKKEP